MSKKTLKDIIDFEPEINPTGYFITCLEETKAEIKETEFVSKYNALLKILHVFLIFS